MQRTTRRPYTPTRAGSSRRIVLDLDADNFDVVGVEYSDLPAFIEAGKAALAAASKAFAANAPVRPARFELALAAALEVLDAMAEGEE